MVILLDETKLKPRLPNYFVWHPFRGTAALVRRDVVHEELELLTFASTRTVGVRVHVPGAELRIYVAYRPPGPDFVEDDIRRALNHDRHPALVVGDFNAKHVAWGSRIITAPGRRLYEIDLVMSNATKNATATGTNSLCFCVL
ncbi:uncharacterized protein LOC134200037 [Bombyx mori]|uniref:uncharacterized protein LOC134200037 n=1 Tax=Bombyx mori TaxID=7091 RepID=UPI002ED265A8